MGKSLLRFKDLRCRGIPWTRTHVDRLEKAGKFPRRVRLGEMTVAWLEDEIEAFVEAKAAQRGESQELTAA